jgi:predicted ester cyclase
MDSLALLGVRYGIDLAESRDSEAPRPAERAAVLPSLSRACRRLAWGRSFQLAVVSLCDLQPCLDQQPQEGDRTRKCRNGRVQIRRVATVIAGYGWRADTTMPSDPDAGSPNSRMQLDTDAAAVIRQYYGSFNERRCQDAAALFAPDALLEHTPFRQQSRGAEGYLRYANTWITALPDVVFTVERIECRGDDMFDVHFVATGTHLGLFDIGGFKFKPTGTKAILRVRELLNIRQGKIASSILSFDTNELIQQLSPVDYVELIARLKRIRLLTDELLGVSGDAERERLVVDRLGPELDAARRAMRPHYNR